MNGLNDVIREHFEKHPKSDYEIDKEYSTTTVIRQYDMQGKFVAEYGSIKEAAKVIKVHSSNLYNHLSGKSNSVGGYKWLKLEVINNG